MLIRNEGHFPDELSSENGSDVDAGLMSATQKTPGEAGEAPSAAPQPGQTAMAGAPSVEGRRTQLRIVRENVKALSKDVGSFRKSHELSIRSLEKQLGSLRKDLAAHARVSDSGSLDKSYKASAKKMEKQVAALHKELSAMKSGIAKDAARSRAKQEAMLSKILAKVSAKPKPAKRAKKR
jgi:hypothetical protein